MKSSVKIIDSTLREGKQSLEKSITEREMLELTEKIISLEIDQLEVGHAAISKEEIMMLRSIKKHFPKISLMTHARAMKNDIEKAIEADVNWVGIFVSVNEYAKFRINDFSIERIMKKVEASIELAKKIT